MDAGVPIKAPVAGISCGLVTEGERFMTMVDIQGLEDFFGDMDFKVGGTHKGITAIQMDLKVHGLTPAIIKEALEKTYKGASVYSGRDHAQAIPRRVKSCPPTRPKMLSTKIDVDKIREVIGKGRFRDSEDSGRSATAKLISKKTAACFISALNTEDAKRPCRWWRPSRQGSRNRCNLQGQGYPPDDLRRVCGDCAGQGLVHISRLDVKRVEKRSRMSYRWVMRYSSRSPRLMRQGRLNLSRRDALIEVEGADPGKHGVRFAASAASRRRLPP